MIDRLSVLCFAGTYGLALLAELARFFVRSTLRWYIAAGLMALAWLVQTAFLANLAIKNPMVLVTTPFESLIVLSWIVAVDRAVLDGPLAPASGYRDVHTAACAGPCHHRGLVCATTVRLARVGGHVRVLGYRTRHFPAGGCGLHMRGVLRRAHVFGTDAATQGEAALPAWPVAPQP